jgi:hypothetical protein
MTQHPRIGGQHQPPLPLIQVRQDRCELRGQHLLGYHDLAHTT